MAETAQRKAAHQISKSAILDPLSDNTNKKSFRPRSKALLNILAHTLGEMKVQIIKPVCPNTETLILVRESKWIQDYNTNNTGLNRINKSKVTLFLLFKHAVFFIHFLYRPCTQCS
jgi:hypothetical protein